MSEASSTTKPPRLWLLALALAVSALLHAATWAGIGQGAFVLWDSIHAFYFQRSYAAAELALAMTGLLIAVAALLLLRRLRWAAIPAFAAMVVSLVMMPRMGMLAPGQAFIHPMQLVAWGALASSWGSCLWLFVLARRAAT